MLALFGTALGSVVVGGKALTDLRDPAALWGLAGAVVYLLGVVLVTAVYRPGPRFPPLAHEEKRMASGDTRPMEGFADFFEVSVTVDASAERLYDLVTNIEGLSEFFPSVSFKLDSDTPLAVGSTYQTRQKGSKTWVPYRVLVLDPNARMSAELIGKDPLFESLRYDHRFIPEGSGTMSRERVDYTFRYGLAGRVLNFVIGKRLVRKQVLDAHKRLREAAGRDQGPVD